MTISTEKTLLIICDKHRHLVCLPYSIDNLHTAARKLEIKRHWFHRNHYDIPLQRIPEIYDQVDKVVHTREILNIIKTGKMTDSVGKTQTP
jgi:hypothetical protein